MSSKTARVADQDSSTYTFGLRIKHPSIDPDEITKALGATPDHAWACGEPRRSEDGLVLGGTRRNSYWSATLQLSSWREWTEQWTQVRATRAATPTVQISPTLLPLSSHLALQLLRLRRHRTLFERLTAEGGEVSLVIEVSPGSTGATFAIEPALARQIADTGLRLELQFD